MIANFQPSLAHGVTAAPPSKSMSHRLLICAGLSAGESLIRHVDLSEDIRATLDCLRALGAHWQIEADGVLIRGIAPPYRFGAPVLECRECGSTLRFFIPICLLDSAPVELRGSRTLLRRPLGVYEDICAGQGLGFYRDEVSLRVRGPLASGVFSCAANVSSQFVSGLLFALPLLPGDSRIKLLPPVESRSYILLTLQALAAFGVKADWADDYTLSVPGSQSYSPRQLTVEGDHSNAAFFQALDLLGGQVAVTGLNNNSLQGDRVYGQLFSRLDQGPAEIDLADCPDLGPVLMAVAAARHGAVFTNARRLRLKESDRGAAMGQELRKFGAAVEADDNVITVRPGSLHRPAEPLYGHNDHRVVMALSVLCSRFGGSIRGAEAVRKSLPDFFERLRALGVKVNEVNTDGMDQ